MRTDFTLRQKGDIIYGMELTLKTCTKCKIEKSLCSFPVRRRKGYKDSVYSWCFECSKEYQKNLRKTQPEKIRATLRRSREKHYDRRLEGGRKSCKLHYKKNKQYYATKAILRKAKLKGAVPTWLTKEQKDEIERFYWLAKDLKAVTGETYHVDHIIPINGKEVCGLHVPWNLQILPSDINLSKGNKV